MDNDSTAPLLIPLGARSVIIPKDKRDLPKRANGLLKGNYTLYRAFVTLTAALPIEVPTNPRVASFLFISTMAEAFTHTHLTWDGNSEIDPQQLWRELWHATEYASPTISALFKNRIRFLFHPEYTLEKTYGHNVASDFERLWIGKRVVLDPHLPVSEIHIDQRWRAMRGRHSLSTPVIDTLQRIHAILPERARALRETLAKKQT